MKKILVGVLVAAVSCQVSFAKSVDEKTAKVICYNFCKSEGLQNTVELNTAYTATSVINGATVNDFYVFNYSANGFVIVAADDNVTPVLGYSSESAFNGSYIPVSIAGWLDNYKNQINYVIEHNVTPSVRTTQAWADLRLVTVHPAAKTTVGTTMLMTSKWSQDPYYNYLCPFDAGAGKHAVTGCVATAMAQVMKYWNWPRRGMGNHSYTSSYGLLSADFGATTYQWDSMPDVIGYNNFAVAQLNSHAGISVNMYYSADESGAFVNQNTSPITNCAEYALKTYFGFKNTLQGVFRAGYDDSAWVHLIKGEVEAGRPSIYTGDGSSGGHCWIADGYANANRIHFNWGWGGYCNGYYIVENLVPGGTDFNDRHTLMYNIEPDSTLVAGVGDIAPTSGLSVYPNPAKEIVNIEIAGTNCTAIRIVDMAGREMTSMVPAASATTASINVAAYPAGIYVAEITTAAGNTSRKVVVAK